MFVLSFFSAKGGTGKTTFNMSMASYLQYVMGRRVLLLDADPPEHSLYNSREREPTVFAIAIIGILVFSEDPTLKFVIINGGGWFVKAILVFYAVFWFVKHYLSERMWIAYLIDGIPYRRCYNPGNFICVSTNCTLAELSMSAGSLWNDYSNEQKTKIFSFV